MSAPVRPMGTPRVLGESLSNRNNSLNLLRLILASIVVLSHAAGLAGFNRWVGLVNGTSAAQIALFGFFAISGYLIAQSAMRSKPLRYLWKRFLRIFPGLLICLLVTAFGFGIIAWYASGPRSCGLSCYFGAPDSPFLYVAKNILLANPFMVQHTIAGTPTGYFAAWNASIWTLFYEFACYVLLVILAVIGILRRRTVALLLFLALWASVILITVTPSLAVHFNRYAYISIAAMLRFSVVFLAGSILYLYRDRVPDSPWLALGSAGLYATGVLWPIFTTGHEPTLDFTPIDIGSPFIVYPILWLGIHLPGRGIGAKNDLSYGIYIYGWPIAELLLIWNANRLGVATFEILALAATIPLAALSWWLVERPSLRLKSLSLHRTAETASDAPAIVTQDADPGAGG